MDTPTWFDLHPQYAHWQQQRGERLWYVARSAGRPEAPQEEETEQEALLRWALREGEAWGDCSALSQNDENNF